MASPNVSILSYGVGNVGSFVNAFKILSVDCNVISNPSSLSSASRLIPGVGKYDDAVKRLHSGRFYDEVIEFAKV